MKILVTGGAGFIGSNLVRLLVGQGHHVLNVDKLTYAGNANNLSDLDGNTAHRLAVADITEAAAMAGLMNDFRPDAVMHLAAESHVDRSIDGPAAFIDTNIQGTFNLLHCSLQYWRDLPADAQSEFRFLHVSTDEVYGSLGASGKFTETTPYDPHSPYSASKAASDHLARAWHDTYGLPVIVTNCSNNYGPYQFPEKLIPVVILKCLRGQPIPVYGKGENIRDWLYVTDHCEALMTVLQRGRVGQTYNIGGDNEMRNIDLVRRICGIMDELAPRGESNELPEANGEWREARHETRTDIDIDSPRPASGRGAGGEGPKTQNPKPDLHSQSSPLATRHSQLISFVTDRPGHDARYAIDAGKIRDELGWRPRTDHDVLLRQTVQWYLDNEDWWQNILSGEYKLERLGQN
ncbi:dTDP-glucose 4,6-dehydratase [Crateriforma conspicua]|uniref:dTDP-glucose 4,6-dehydratase n=1 Tax=Crateriforma conspicua TaxID=2527996 RepID=UPI00118BCD65|nr:dTDP-glucose 4,6-dehydratase [Crateriforma conspicua]QDV65930.1 dTDP-glucose 4,6-dehydratase 2 [Crateriforma conspicua]